MDTSSLPLPKLYIDYKSQPSRAVLTLCRINKIPVEIVPIEVMNIDIESNRSVYSKFYKSKNPNSQVPCFEETDGFLLSESHSILRYLCESRNEVADYFYPENNLKLRSRIDQYLDNHHLNLRLACGTFIFRKYVLPAIGKPLPKAMLKECEVARNKTFRILNRILYKSNFICSNEKPTLADISAICEVRQYFILVNCELELKYPNVYDWMQRMMKIPEISDQDKYIKEIAMIIRGEAQPSSYEAKL